MSMNVTRIPICNLIVIKTSVEQTVDTASGLYYLSNEITLHIWTSNVRLKSHYVIKVNETLV